MKKQFCYKLEFEYRENNYTNAWWWKQNLEAFDPSMVVSVPKDGWKKAEYTIKNPEPLNKKEFKIRALEIFAQIIGCQYKNIKLKRIQSEES